MEILKIKKSNQTETATKPLAAKELQPKKNTEAQKLEIAPQPKTPPEETLTPIAEASQEEASASEPSSSQEENSKQTLFYQAIGWLYGQVGKTDDGKLEIILKDRISFVLTAKPHILLALHKQIENSPNQLLWLRCYPQYKVREQILYFNIVTFLSEPPEEAKPGIFILRGIWQFIPQSKRPVFSIYRNELHNEKDRIKNQHLPLIWHEQQPFRFRKDSPERPQFFQIEARLLSKKNCFGWAANLAEPTKPPRKLKKPPSQTPPSQTPPSQTLPDKPKTPREQPKSPERPIPKPEKL